MVRRVKSLKHAKNEVRFERIYTCMPYGINSNSNARKDGFHCLSLSGTPFQGCSIPRELGMYGVRIDKTQIHKIKVIKLQVQEDIQ